MVATPSELDKNTMAVKLLQALETTILPELEAADYCIGVGEAGETAHWKATKRYKHRSAGGK